MRCWARAICLVLLGVVGCQRLVVRGGSSLSAQEAQLLLVTERFVPRRCVDERGRVVRDLEQEVLSLTPRGVRGEALLITRPGEEAWLIEQAFEQKGERVFQLSLEGGEHGSLLRDVRLTRGAGRMALTRRWKEQRKDGRVRAHFEGAQLSCELALSTVRGG